MEFSMSDNDAADQQVADADETETDALAPEADAEEPDDVGGADDADSEDGDEGEDNEADEEVEYDLGGGQKLKVKANATAKEVFEAAQKAFKDVEGNFTRKQQAVAEQVKSVQARAEAVQKLETLNGEALQEYSKGLNLRSDIEQLSQRVSQAKAAYEQAQYNAHLDPETARRAADQYRYLSDTLRDKQGDFQATVAKVAQLEAGMTQAQQAEMARIEAEGIATLEKRVKGFSQKVPEIIDYVSSTYGIDKDHAAKVWKMDPATAEMAYKAMMFDRMQASSRKPGVKPSAAPKPVTAMKVAGAAKAAPDVTTMTPAQMDKYLNSGRR
jgi:hypothetical protein